MLGACCQTGTSPTSKLFAQQGGEGVAVDPHGNVYLAAGQVYVYDPQGKLIDTIDTPQRPIQIVFWRQGWPDIVHPVAGFALQHCYAVGYPPPPEKCAKSWEQKT